MKIFDTFKRDLQVERRDNGHWDTGTGLFIKGGITTFTIKASVDPTPAEVMLTLPEGFRNRETYTLYTDTQLLTAKPNGNISDVVLLEEDRYRVIKVAHWANTILNHFEIIVSKEDIDVDK